jgi:alpha-1,2-mannosyltransferase
VTRARPIAPYVAAVVAGAVLCLYLATVAHKFGLDLRVYRDSATAFREGRDPYRLTFTHHDLPFTYPPFALAVLTSLTWASYAVTQWAEWVVSVAATTVAVVIVLLDRGFPKRVSIWCGAFAWVAASMLVLEPARSGIDYGQIEFVLMFLVVADLLVIPAPFRGIAVGIAAAIKLTPLIFVVVLVVRRDWASTARVLLSFVFFTLFSWLLWPNLSRVFWHRDVTRPGRVGPVANASNQSWFGIVHRAPFPATGSAPTWLALSLVTVLLGVFIAWRCTQTERQSFAVIAVALVGLLISPISWSHHWVWVVLIPPMLIGPLRHDTRRVVRSMLWGIVAITVLGPYWWVGRGAGADLLEALLPVWTFATLAVWSMVEHSQWSRPMAGSDHDVVAEAGATELSPTGAAQ